MNIPALNPVYRLYQAWKQARRCRADARVLARMDARDLADLGLGYGEAAYWVQHDLCHADVTAQRSQWAA